MKKNSRGQGSLEIIFLAGIVVALAFTYMAAYLPAQDTIVAQVIAKNLLTEKLNVLDQAVIIETIRPMRSGPQALDLQVRTRPVVPKTALGTDGEAELNRIEQEIQGKTSFTSVQIHFNE